MDPTPLSGSLKYKRVYSREFIINQNDPNLPLPAGFTRYTGLMKNDPPQSRRRMFSSVSFLFFKKRVENGILIFGALCLEFKE
jgi:hypothetical protein